MQTRNVIIAVVAVVGLLLGALAMWIPGSNTDIEPALTAEANTPQAVQAASSGAARPAGRAPQAPDAEAEPDDGPVEQTALCDEVKRLVDGSTANDVIKQAISDMQWEAEFERADLACVVAMGTDEEIIEHLEGLLDGQWDMDAMEAETEELGLDPATFGVPDELGGPQAAPEGEEAEEGKAP